MEVRDQVVVVTGAASGIGAALTRRLAAEGPAGVAALDIDAAGVGEVAAEVGGLGLGVDMADAAAVEAAIDRVEAELGPIALFCSNAGVGGAGGFELPNEEWQRQWDINVMAHVHAARALVPRWCARGSGHMLITASAAGLLTQLGSAPYSVTKAAAVAVAEWLTITYGERGVTASALCPQAVRTPMTAGLEDGVASVDGMLEPEAVAEAAVAGLASGQFLVLPHAEVAGYVALKGNDRDRWVAGMRKLQRRYPQV